MNYYAKAIDILHSDDLDKNKLVIELAKKHPKILCDLVLGVTTKKELLDKELIKLMNTEGSIIPAVKHLRDKTGATLKEAKAYIDNLKAEAIQ